MVRASRKRNTAAAKKARSTPAKKKVVASVKTTPKSHSLKTFFGSQRKVSLTPRKHVKEEEEEHDKIVKEKEEKKEEERAEEEEPVKKDTPKKEEKANYENEKESNQDNLEEETMTASPKANDGTEQVPVTPSSSSEASSSSSSSLCVKSPTSSKRAKKGDKALVGRLVCKLFDGQAYKGQVMHYDQDAQWYKIRYTDGDEEEMSEGELHSCLVANDEKQEWRTSPRRSPRKAKATAELQVQDEEGLKKRRKTTSSTNSPTRARRTSKAINYTLEYNSSEEEESPLKKPKRKPAKKRRAIKDNNNDDDEDSEASVESVPSDEDDAISLASSSSEEENVQKERKNQGKKRGWGSLQKQSTKTTTKTSTPKPKLNSKEATKPKTKMADAFKPYATPLYHDLSLDQISAQKEFLDPCGMEATDDVIDGLVGEQVEKLGGLLERALSGSEVLGSKGRPWKLGTACSGTDAPALALTLVQEQMELRGMRKKKDVEEEEGLFWFEHEFSCENDPFKQAYLARNFDSILYPDIAKLTSPTPRDVYGQAQPLPSIHLFVAGTSCKNFSMLRSNQRLDIEDKGCSGETFLAACEVLFQERPEMAIFENVIGAPWGKMQEYITGRVKLSECDSKKAIKDVKDGKKELIFVLMDDDDEENEDKDANSDAQKKKKKKIVVDQVPSVYGVRCGAVVQGYLTPNSNTLRPLQWPHTKSTCTLSELISKNRISRAQDTLVLQTPCTYCTHLAKVDTKDYGLPQTRLRTYMFVWRPKEEGDVKDDLGVYWEAIVRHLKSRVRHSLESFILQVDHDIIRVFREALNGPAGRQTKRGTFLEPDFWTSANANLPHNKIARERLGMQDEARALTSWGPYGQKQVPPHYWLEYLHCLNQREMDLLEILHASAARDAETHDANFSHFFWNVSQNASKERHRTACPGIAGCITPGGDFFLPHLGRPLLGCEKLLIQGIPYFRLMLGNETEVQIGDLAGNAMSLTVVCATMLAALACGQLREECRQSLGKPEQVLKTCGWKKKDEDKPLDEKKKTKDVGGVFTLPYTCASTLLHSLAPLAEEAVSSSIWCTCESSGRNSLTTHFLQCRVCRASCCRNCVSTTAGYQLSSHDTMERDISVEEHGLGKFQTKLRHVVPPSLYFTKESLEDIVSQNSNHEDVFRVRGLEKYVFHLHRIKRDWKKWWIIYYARENHGMGEAVAEFRFTVGELKREGLEGEVEMGVRGELTSFQPARTKPLVYGPLEPCVIVSVKYEGEKTKSLVKNKKSKHTLNWMTKQPEKSAIINIVGSDPADSERVELGLTDVAADYLQENANSSLKAKWFQKSKNHGEARRWVYAKNWKTWPDTIIIGANDDEDSDESVTALYGIYKRARCRQTINQSALWIRQGTDEQPTLYILIRPNVNRTGPDVAIISSSSFYMDSFCILAEFSQDWQPCDALLSERHVNKIRVKSWSPLATIECRVPVSRITVTSPKEEPDTLVHVSGLSEADVTMLCSSGVSPTLLAQGGGAGTFAGKLNVTKGQKAQQTIRVFNSLCVAPMLHHAAGEGLKYDVGPEAPWTLVMNDKNSAPLGCCTKTVPIRPKEEWKFNQERQVWERQSTPGASRKYYLALQEAPQPFELWLDGKARSLTVKCFPEVAAHHAAGQLMEGRGGTNMHKEVKVSFRLSDVTQQTDPVIEPFRVRNCNKEAPTSVPLKDPFSLYERQQKALTKMIQIESRKTEMEELEMSEHEMPGSAGLSLMAKATRNTTLCGGVIADAIGAGKTVISIAMIINGMEQAKKSRELPRKSGATLVVVPPALIRQWKMEIHKFTTALKVLCVYDFDSLKRISVKEMVEADVVICPIDILEAKGYMPCVVKWFDSDEKGMKNGSGDCPKLPMYTGQMEQNGANGVWIPASSADPYGGGNNSNNQKRRNESAYYTYVYLKSIQRLRETVYKGHERGVPLEYFEWERVIVDEIHESLCTTRDEMKLAKESSAGNKDCGSGFFKEKNRRAGRELLGITQKDTKQRPLLYRKAIFGLTGTPLLDSSSRVIELANLMGNTYIIGLSNHWRKLERESCRDIFLHNYLEPKQSREMRKHIYAKCQEYLDIACCRNKAGEEMRGIALKSHNKVTRMSSEEAKLYLKSQSGISPAKQSFSIQPEDFDVSAGHDISKFLRQNAKFACRGNVLVQICRDILGRKGDEKTKIIVFTDGRIGAGEVARDFLCAEKDLRCTWLDREDTVETNNKKISWYQSADATAEDKARPRVLVLHFEHAAGLNLQSECHNLILFTPLYVGEGGSNSDPVSDASTELQAIGRVFRPGQTKQEVNVYRIEVRGPSGEECIDGQLIRRNMDKETVEMAVNASD